MVDSTRSKFNMDRIEEVIVKLTSNQLNLIAAQNAMSTKLDKFLQRMALLETTQYFPFSATTKSPPIDNSWRLLMASTTIIASMEQHNIEIMSSMSLEKQLAAKLISMMSWSILEPDFSSAVTALVTKQFFAHKGLSEGFQCCHICHGKILPSLQCAPISHLWRRHWPSNCYGFAFFSSSLTQLNMGQDLTTNYGDWFPNLDPELHRRCGILLHPTSFPSPYKISDLGEEAFCFFDWLNHLGCSIWQILPSTALVKSLSRSSMPGLFSP